MNVASAMKLSVAPVFMMAVIVERRPSTYAILQGRTKSKVQRQPEANLLQQTLYIHWESPHESHVYSNRVCFAAFAK